MSFVRVCQVDARAVAHASNLLTSGLRKITSSIACGHFNHVWRASRNIPLNLSRSVQTMASHDKDHPGHLHLTAEESRSRDYVPVTISSIRDLTPRVKAVRLRELEPGSISYKAGQWVDFKIPGIDVVGGFSFTSCPGLSDAVRVGCNAAGDGEMDLAIKYSDHPPAAWVHNTAKVGDSVSIRVGGSFLLEKHLNAARAPVRTLSFVAGGIGINPLYAMLLQLTALPSLCASLDNINMLYSVKHSEEYAFLPGLKWLAQDTGSPLREKLRLHVTATGEGDRKATVEASLPFRSTHVYHGRIGKLELSTACGPEPNECAFFLCGPPRMTNAVTDMLVKDLAVPSQHVFTEKWW